MVTELDNTKTSTILSPLFSHPKSLMVLPTILLYQTSRPRNIHHRRFLRHRRRRHRGRHLLTRSTPCWRPPKRRGPPRWRRCCGVGSGVVEGCPSALGGKGRPVVFCFVFRGVAFVCLLLRQSPKIKRMRYVIMILFLLGSFLFSKGFFWQNLLGDDEDEDDEHEVSVVFSRFGRERVNKNSSIFFPLAGRRVSVSFLSVSFW